MYLYFIYVFICIYIMKYYDILILRDNDKLKFIWRMN